MRGNLAFARTPRDATLLGNGGAAGRGLAPPTQPTEGPMSSAPTSPTPDVNYWPDRRCPRAFRDQRELPPYRKLLADTVAWLDPAPGERWLDLGCGYGQLTRSLWEKSNGSLAGIVALDCADVNADAIAQLRRHAHPPAGEHQICFQ